MAATMRSLFSVMIVIVLVAQIPSITMAQSCASSLSSLNACAPFVLPGAAAPNVGCCTALQTVDHDCLCNTLRIANSMPSQCNLPPLSCSGN